MYNHLNNKPNIFLLDISFRDNGAQEINCRQFVKIEESHYGMQIPTRVRSSILIPHFSPYIHFKPLDRRTIHADDIPHCNACMHIYNDKRTQARRA